jgi:hypothetical protein
MDKQSNLRQREWNKCIPKEWGCSSHPKPHQIILQGKTPNPTSKANQPAGAYAITAAILPRDYHPFNRQNRLFGSTTYVAPKIILKYLS